MDRLAARTEHPRNVLMLVTWLVMLGLVRLAHTWDQNSLASVEKNRLRSAVWKPTMIMAGAVAKYVEISCLVVSMSVLVAVMKACVENVRFLWKLVATAAKSRS